MSEFDEIIDRSTSGCVKYSALKNLFGREDIIPLWVADMDWNTPGFIVEAMKERLAHPIFGYTSIPDSYFPMIAGWVKDLLDWQVDPSHIRYIPGIVKGIGFAERCFLQPGDKVIIQPPVYHPFRIVTENCGCQPVYNPLLPRYDEEGYLVGYDMDFDGLESVIDDKCRMLILANPHNPAGVCWSRETLQRLASICAKHGILVISDEIHGEMAFTGHAPYASVSPEAAANSISFLAPSKTFNIAGIVSSYCIVPDPAVREKFFAFLSSCEIDSPSIMSIVATEAAYTKGAAWRREMLEYVSGNIDFVCGFLKDNVPGIRALRPQASFLIWLDCRKLGLSHDELISLFVDKARIGLNDGAMFGAEGEGFMRLNVGCPRSILETAMKQLAAAVATLKG